VTKDRTPELWGAGEIRAHCGNVSRVTFRRWRDAGTFPDPLAIVNQGRTPVWDAGSVRAWYAAHRKRLAELGL
jgi:predicted DNA-binding transcriptional regulator AlpA